MTLTKTSRAWLVGFFIILATGIAFFGGNQRLAYAETRFSRIESPRSLVPSTFVNDDSLASQIICRVFTQLNELGDPIPFLDPGGSCPRDPQCSDGIDNDNDGLIDAADPSCHLDFDETNSSSYHPNIDDESFTPSATQCSDGIDNDNDGFIDENDPNCHSDGDATNPSSYDPSRRTESGSLPACFNGVDDDGDGLVDLNDPGCSSATDNDETDENGGGGGNQQCSDGIDNDDDGFTDENDPNCHSDGDATNEDSYDTNRSEEGDLPACFNGIDDDEDGLVDLDDPGCASAVDDDETDPAVAPQCSDGIDNDEDGLTDLDDPGCSSVGDNDETDPTNGGGGGSPQCSDGIDNDGDGLIDLDDPGCGGGASDNSEADPSSGGGNNNPPPSSGGGGSGLGGTILGLYGAIGGSSGTILDEPLVACDAYLTEFIKFGNANNPQQVRRLQLVLRDFEGHDVPVDGVYDQRTLDAVHRFQAKYASDILTPWGIDQSTGFVYLTTRKKVNEIYCKGTKQFPLTPQELSIIQRTKAIVDSVVNRGAQGATTTKQDSETPQEEITGTEAPPASLPNIKDLLNIIGSSDDTSSQTASVADALDDADATTTEDIESFWQRFFRVLRRGLSPQE